ncbi:MULTISPECIES: FAD-binding protein [Micromonospora]|uniref:FAD-binding protein n=1 Tax=Micromonospora solifontis TaxID=2487138 RepID=A0ABX9WFB5_9ACTN|nr:MULTISPECIES: FAD-binding protein [Micromonospora]NES13878.1 FAD-binding protein [Micromonospora sp. PPF5-17B]NES37947.1 FAD-binding protein [Micromonospora solifontis]NES53978.1 FAD-binding protein [Micromonospora sp. PPF5-6]RNL97796.1 FAD-binding protein [Micromonospora solifontis]
MTEPAATTPAPPPVAGRNWAGNVHYSARARHRPTTLDEVRRLVARAERVRAVGTGHSFNRLGDTTGDLISLAGLPPTGTLDRDRGTVTVPAGLRYGDLATRLHTDGYAVANLASLPHISVAGAVATATHGSGRANGNLATGVAGLELVTADGELLTVDRTDPRFAGMVVNLGALGVVTRLTLDVVPTFAIRQYVRLGLPRHALDAALDGAYSASVFTDWRSDRLDQVWLKRHADEPAPPADWLGTRAADAPVHPVPGMPPENCTIQLGEAGPWHERLPHFRLGFTPSSGDELQSEWHVGRADAAAALAALEPAAGRIAAVLQICEIRTIAADDLWLSPNYERDSVALHFTWIGDPAAVAPVLTEVEERLAPFAPRPHWGKLFDRDPATGYPRFDDFRALLREFDPAGKFRTDELDRYFARD